jgi:hypothetical protein
VEHGNVGEGLDAPREDHVGVSECDLIGGVGDRLRSGGAGAIERVRRDTREQLGEEAHLARHVRHADGRHDLAEDHLVHLAPVELGPKEQLARGVAGQRRRGDVAEDGPALGEGRAQAGHDGHAPPGPGVMHLVPTVSGE